MNGQAWSTSPVDEQRDDEVVLGEAPFNEQRALEELQRMRQEIRRYQTVREGVIDEFERFVQSFKKPEAAPIVSPEPRRVMPEARVPEPAPPPAPPASPEPIRNLEQSRAAEPPAASAPPPPVIPEASIPAAVIQPASARFEPLNLEPFIKRVDDGDAAAPSLPPPPPRVPASPEEFIAEEQENNDIDAFSPGADFDALPPPLPPVPETLPPTPPPVAAPASSSRTWVVLASMLAVVAVGGYAWKLTHSSDGASVEQPAAGAAPAAQPIPGRTATPPRPAPAANAPATATLQSEVVTTQRAWVRVIADGQRVVERELPADSRIPFDAQKTIQIRTGNAGAVRLTIRGVDKGALGRVGEVVTRSFNVPAR